MRKHDFVAVWRMKFTNDMKPPLFCLEFSKVSPSDLILCFTAEQYKSQEQYMLQGDRQKAAAAKIKTLMYESPVLRPDVIDEAAVFLAEPHQYIPFLAANKNITLQNKILL